MADARKYPRKRTTVKPPPTPEERARLKPAPLRAPKHGHGALRVGNPGCRGGTGRPPTLIRADALGIVDRSGLARLAKIIDNAETADVDAIRATDVAWRIGSGGPLTKQDVAVRLQATLDIVVAHVPDDRRDAAMSALREVWR